MPQPVPPYIFCTFSRIRTATFLGVADRRSVFDSLRKSGIGVNVHYIPVHTQPYYRALGFQPGDFPEAERYYARAITLPLYPGLTDAEQDAVVEALEVAAR